MVNLLLLFFIPFISSAILFLLPSLSFSNAKRLAFLLSLIPLAVLIVGGNDLLDTSAKLPWIPTLNIEFYLKVEGVSLLFLYLTSIIVPISILAVRPVEMGNIFFGLILLLEALLVGFFTARDLVLFTVLWEGMLLPLYFIINLWGESRRESASIRFLIYMIAGSTLMVAAVLALGSISGSFNLDTLQSSASTTPYAALIFGVFLLAFAVKTPLFPFHAWLPEAYTQAPLAGTILLSALLSKAGIYGIVRIGFELFPELLKAWSPILLTFAIAGVLFGAFAAWRQNDYKRLIAYSSFSHVNFVLAGLFVWNWTAHEGAILQAFNHGITIAALFLVAGWLQDRLGTTRIGESSGLAAYMPYLCWLTLFFVLSSVALPGMNNFIGELLILLGVFSYNPWLAALLGLTVIFSVVYMLRWMQKDYFGPKSELQASWTDIKLKQYLIALPLILIVLWVGIYPQPFLKLIEQSKEISKAAP